MCVHVCVSACVTLHTYTFFVAFRAEIFPSRSHVRPYNLFSSKRSPGAIFLPFEILRVFVAVKYGFIVFLLCAGRRSQSHAAAVLAAAQIQAVQAKRQAFDGENSLFIA